MESEFSLARNSDFFPQLHAGLNDLIDAAFSDLREVHAAPAPAGVGFRQRMTVRRNNIAAAGMP